VQRSLPVPLAVLALLAAAPAASAFTGLGPARLSQAPEPTTLVAGTPQEGTLTSVGQVDTYLVDVPPTLTLVRVTIAQENSDCEVWAHLLDRGGTEVSDTYVTHSGISLVADSVGEDTYVLEVDSGPLQACTGAVYMVQAAMGPLRPQRLAAPRSSGRPEAVSRSAAGVTCQIYCGAASKTATRVRNLTAAISAARGSRRGRLAAARRRLRVSYRRFHRLEVRWCRQAGLG
jgi:hypothetical protein